MLKTYLLTLSFITVVIIASAVSKMVMYMQVYGLTQLRVYTSWFMILTAVIFVMAIVKIISRKFNAVKIICVFFTAWFLVLNYAGVDALITKYNIARSAGDNSAALDVNMFGSLSDSMVPAAVGLLNSEDISIRYEARVMLTSRYNKLQNEKWQAIDLAGMKAKKILEPFKDKFYDINNSTGKPVPETDKGMLLRHLPNVTGIESCTWYLEPIFHGSGDTPETFVRSGEVGYHLYGYAVLQEAYYNEIVNKNEWLERFAGLSSFNSNIYFENLPAGKTYFESYNFNFDQSSQDNMKFLLEKTERKLYFWVNPMY
jgi:hypothetical protein